MFLNNSNKRFALNFTRFLNSQKFLINNRYLTSSQNANQDANDNLNEDLLKNKILESSLKFVPQYGFTTDAINQGASAIGYSSAAKGIFKNGSFDLIDYFYKKSNDDVGLYLEKLVKEGKVTKKNELIRLALQHRLSLIQTYIEHWPKAMAIQTLNPSYAIKSIENLLRLCDEIWYQCGDNSTDFNWYTKRLTLAAVYKSTEFFMIQDKSENFKETNEFLENRLNDVNNFGKLKSKVLFLIP